MQCAIGLIETVGLAAAVVALDAALKAADVKGLEIENSRGGGRQTVKITGEVSAVKAACEAAESAVAIMGGDVYSRTVIARPGEGIDELFIPDDYVTYTVTGNAKYLHRGKETSDTLASPEAEAAETAEIKAQVTDAVPSAEAAVPVEKKENKETEAEKVTAPVIPEFVENKGVLTKNAEKEKK